MFKLSSFYYAIGTLFLTMAMIRFPDQTFEASIRGLTLWSEIVFPSLLPFFIMAELLLALGIVKAIGILLEPIMRPLFNVSGAGSIGVGMGLISGYPSGAKIASRLRQEGSVTQLEAERLLAFTNASNPLFIFGAVAVGFFHDATLGWLIAVSHYGASLGVGLCMRFYQKQADRTSSYHQPKRHLLADVRQTLHHQLKTSPPLGQMLGEAVMSSIKTLVMIGGFIILFSVANKLLFMTGISGLLSIVFKFILMMFGLPDSLALPIVSGLLEITLGTQMVAQTSEVTLFIQLLMVSILLAFNGLSIHAQVASIIADTDIRYAPYLLGRLLHMILAACLLTVLYRPLYINKQGTTNSHVPVDTSSFTPNAAFDMFNTLQSIGPFVTGLTLAVGVVLLFKKYPNQLHKWMG
ncbi:sporulation integral membrane protein YlbJ [Alkalibacillus flavidus]|uniref:Sporulation integral membrane protein YlbJ n=1 Tax=Alkalibacillus flavidus TaxID=546021 RepID=A0ABV2KU01_9BACI